MITISWYNEITRLPTFGTPPQLEGVRARGERVRKAGVALSLELACVNVRTTGSNDEYRRESKVTKLTIFSEIEFRTNLIKNLLDEEMKND